VSGPRVNSACARGLRSGFCLLSIRLAGGDHSRACKHALYFFNGDVAPIEGRSTDTQINAGGGGRRNIGASADQTPEQFLQ
jgi:hypothetical protein